MLKRQCEIDIFFVDWETAKRSGRGGAEDDTVSCWRRLFIANEWHELQLLRMVSTQARQLYNR